MKGKLASTKTKKVIAQVEVANVLRYLIRKNAYSIMNAVWSTFESSCPLHKNTARITTNVGIARMSNFVNCILTPLLLICGMRGQKYEKILVLLKCFVFSFPIWELSLVYYENRKSSPPPKTIIKESLLPSGVNHVADIASIRSSGLSLSQTT